jgi:hypothetical protein
MCPVGAISAGFAGQKYNDDPFGLFDEGNEKTSGVMPYDPALLAALDKGKLV